MCPRKNDVNVVFVTNCKIQRYMMFLYCMPFSVLLLANFKRQVLPGVRDSGFFEQMGQK
jgi:hypothetical protein